jgi:hypothetical protein
VSINYRLSERDKTRLARIRKALDEAEAELQELGPGCYMLSRLHIELLKSDWFNRPKRKAIRVRQHERRHRHGLYPVSVRTHVRIV